ncbi:hypothetical protein [Apibacter sp. wkB309]|uniref:hypothetical protein n=1 Tax=Apibacter sp. wkB309 TaxID=1679467 RepID=UPI000CF84075|nr:hypothetical protein [Apibacter sp. wkB309]PQL89612.1 hypothetical protein C4S75_06360 [Apibacter sp. wkB309]
MTVKELKEKINDLPDDMEVMLEQTKEEFKYGLLNTIKVNEELFIDPFFHVTLITDESIILSDE